MKTLDALKVFLTTVGLGTCCCGLAAVGTNFSDQWWNPAEPGWAASILQQSDLLFVDVLVYDAGGFPIWYTVTAFPQAGAATGHAGQLGERGR